MRTAGWLLSLCLIVGCSTAGKDPVVSVDGTMDAGTTDTPTADARGEADLVGDAVGSMDGVDGAGDAPTPDTGDVVTPPGCPNASAEWLDGVCDGFCAKLEEFDLNDLFAPPPECHGMCLEVLGDNPDWLPNFLCVNAMEQHYFFGNCWWPKPLEPVVGCDAWCAEAVECGVTGMFHVPEDPCLCEAACTGIFTMTGEAAGPLIGCATEVLAESCDVFAMMDCFGMPLNCEDVCSGLEGECEPGENLDGLFPEDGDCVALCQTLSQEQLFALQVCISVAGCGNAAVCGTVPEEPPAGCAETCDAYNAVCPVDVIPPVLCPWACAGAAQAIPGADPQGAAACIEEAGSCPDEPGYLLVSCLAGKCTLMCYQVPAECDPGSAWFDAYPTSEACEAECGQLTDFQARAAGICHLVAGCDQPELCGAPPAAPAAGCGAYCEALLDLCPDVPWFGGIDCEAFCTGLTMVYPGADPATAPECMALYESCPDNVNDALFGCLGGKCGGVCGYFDKCEPGSPYYQLFESKGACQEYCSALTYEEALTTAYCLSWAGCGNALDCQELPGEVPQGCDTWCETVFDICPQNGMVSETLCPAACAGIAMTIAVAEPADADACYDEFDQCPENPAEVVYGCMVDSDTTCKDVCKVLHGCELTLDWVCEIFCTELEEENPAAYGYFADCVQDAGSCTAMKPCVGQ